MAGESNEAVSAHRVGRRIDIMSRSNVAVVRPWTMKQRAELKPLLAAVFSRLQSPEASDSQLSIASIMLHAEDELVAIARATVELPPDVSWDDLLWEDLPAIIQAIWETSVVTPLGGGIAGKTIGLLAGFMRTIMTATEVQVEAAKQAKANGVDRAPKTSPHLTSVPRPN